MRKKTATTPEPVLLASGVPYYAPGKPLTILDDRVLVCTETYDHAGVEVFGGTMPGLTRHHKGDLALETSRTVRRNPRHWKRPTKAEVREYRASLEAERIAARNAKADALTAEADKAQAAADKAQAVADKAQAIAVAAQR